MFVIEPSNSISRPWVLGRELRHRGVTVVGGHQECREVLVVLGIDRLIGFLHAKVGLGDGADSSLTAAGSVGLVALFSGVIT